MHWMEILYRLSFNEWLSQSHSLHFCVFCPSIGLRLPCTCHLCCTASVLTFVICFAALASSATLSLFRWSWECIPVVGYLCMRIKVSTFFNYLRDKVVWFLTLSKINSTFLNTEQDEEKKKKRKSTHFGQAVASHTKFRLTCVHSIHKMILNVIQAPATPTSAIVQILF